MDVLLCHTLLLTLLFQPNVFIPFGNLTPLSNAEALAEAPAHSSPRLSTPSTVPSSLIDLHSLSLRVFSPAASDSRSDHSRHSSTDSILADGNDLSFTAISQAHSVTQISPRAVFLTLTQAHNDEDSRPLSEFTRARGPDTVTYPSLGITARTQYVPSPTHSPMGSTIYESFVPSARSMSPVDHPLTQLVHEGDSTARAPRIPSPERLYPPAQLGPGSTTSWSDVASDNGDEPEFLVGSDVESWASVSDRAA